ncbi:MAG: hypothetical protein WCH43_06240 [Verrucomicrobiota bacterium]
MNSQSKITAVLLGLAVVFLLLAAGFYFSKSTAVPVRETIQLVDVRFLNVATWRKSYKDLLKAKEAGAIPAKPKEVMVYQVKTTTDEVVDLVKANDEMDLTDFDCYGCHEKGKVPQLRFDANQNLIIPDEHKKDIVMGHGSHGRNNNCFNCHNENNLELLQTRDGREIKFEDSPQLCGSCHGPTYRDWEAGAHGRTSGYWDRSKGPIDRKLCVNCHDPHTPHYPGRHPAPGPHPLRGPAATVASTEPESKP